MQKEMAVDGKWFKGSNNRLHRVVSALAQQRPFPKKYVLRDANAMLIDLKHQARREYEARQAKRELQVLPLNSLG